MSKHKDGLGRGPVHGVSGVVVSFFDWIFDSVDERAKRAAKENNVRKRTENSREFNAYEKCPRCMERGHFPFEGTEKDGEIREIERKCTHCDYTWRQT
ncbi:hypothetical protein [Mycolicibacter arupensis]|uniref:Uncharacterized protein n=1 Tax=Mycolicibacter arupensis TaxID=342002 RepID=A0A5C7Y1Y2_9MYCO|nr:hypothetical protein [Mycolicibacter arupensis]TXI55576.1 MAG: hypothetical protein E6Q54_12290 [Mycolicibacter arupensis]